jgi:uncharacterized membrane protein/protein-disulfide isomerase
MPRPSRASSLATPARPFRIGWYAALASLGLAAAAASTVVHYRLLRDPTYASVCDVSSTVSCSEAYMSRYGSVGGVPVALVGVLYFALVLGLIALCARSTSARPNLPGYLFALSTLGLAVVLYLAYASFVVLGAMCLLCVGTYAAVIGLFVLSAAQTSFPMKDLPARLRRDVGTLLQAPAALSACIAFTAAAAGAVAFFPGEQLSAEAGMTLPPSAPSAAQPALSAAQPASSSAPPAAASSAPSAAQSGSSAPSAAPQSQSAPSVLQLEQWLSQQPRVPLMVPGGGAAVVIVKFNDYQCPPCRQTWLEYKPVLAKYEQQQPGKVTFVTRDFPLEPECNTFTPNELHPAACEAAVAVRLAREKGKAEAMEEWLFANQPSLTGAGVREAAKSVGGVTDFDARYPATLELVRGDVAQGGQLNVRGTPTFFMNGIRLPGLRAEFFDAAIQWQLRQGGSKE